MPPPCTPPPTTRFRAAAGLGQAPDVVGPLHTESGSECSRRCPAPAESTESSLHSPPSPGLETTEGQANLKPTSMEGTVFTFYSLVPRELGAGGWSAPTSRVDTWSWWSQQCHPWHFPWCLPGSVTGRIPQLRSYKRRKAACHERRAKKSTVGRGRCR